MMRLKFNTTEFKEILVVGAVMLGILLPARMAFISIIGNSWLGSFGVVSAVAISILYLAKKNKLGWFGKAFMHQMLKINKSKRRYLIYPNIAFAIVFTSFVIYGIEMGDTIYKQEQEDLLSQIPQDQQNMEGIMKESGKVKPTDFIIAIFVIFYTMFFRFDIFSVLVSTLNSVSNQFLAHLATIMLVEQLELAGILIFFKLGIKKATT